MKNKMKIFLMKLFLFYRNTFKFKPIVLGKVFNGIGIGLISDNFFSVCYNFYSNRKYSKKGLKWNYSSLWV